MANKKDDEYFYFTFGCGQVNKNCYVKIKGSYEEARRIMFIEFGNNWAFQYSSDDWSNRTHPVSGEKGTQAEIYNLSEILL